MQTDIVTAHPPQSQAVTDLRRRTAGLRERIARRIALAIIAWGRGPVDRRETAIRRHAAAEAAALRERSAEREARLLRSTL